MTQGAGGGVRGRVPSPLVLVDELPNLPALLLNLGALLEHLLLQTLVFLDDPLYVVHDHGCLHRDIGQAKGNSSLLLQVIHLSEGEGRVPVTGGAPSEGRSEGGGGRKTFHKG